MGKKHIGKAWVFGHNINADAAITYSSKVSETYDMNELAKYCMVGYYPEFPKEAKKGDIIVAGKNFACGHLHPHFSISLRGVGIAAIIAESFSRRYYRDGLNEGMPLFEAESVLEKIHQGDEIELDFRKGNIHNLTSGVRLYANPLPEFLVDMVEAGGLIPYLKNKLTNSPRPCPQI